MNHTYNSTHAAQLAVNDVIGRKFIVVTLNSEAGTFSMSAVPVRHENLASAERECDRLAKLSPGTVYIAMQFRSGRLVPKVTSIQAF